MNVNEIRKQIKPIIENLGYYLYDVEKVTENKNKILRVIIDKKEGINITDCEKVNEIIDPVIFKDDTSDIEYFEVSSAGIEKVLKTNEHLEHNKLSDVEVKLYNKMKVKENETKNIIGVLKDFDENILVLSLDDGTELKINRENIAQVKVIYDFSKDFGGENESNR